MKIRLYQDEALSDDRSSSVKAHSATRSRHNSVEDGEVFLWQIRHGRVQLISYRCLKKLKYMRETWEREDRPLCKRGKCQTAANRITVELNVVYRWRNRNWICHSCYFVTLDPQMEKSNHL